MMGSDRTRAVVATLGEGAIRESEWSVFKRLRRHVKRYNFYCNFKVLV